MDKKLLGKVIQYLEKEEYKVHSVYLTGSRAYGFHTEESDYDLVAFVLPTQEDVLLGKKFVSVVRKPNLLMVEEVAVKDVRYLLDFLKKPSFNSLFMLDEPLYLNGKNFFSKEESLESFYANSPNFLNSLAGIYQQRLNRSSKAGTYEQRSANHSSKNRAHALFLAKVYKAFCEGEDFRKVDVTDCLKVRNKEKKYSLEPMLPFLSPREHTSDLLREHQEKLEKTFVKAFKETLFGGCENA